MAKSTKMQHEPTGSTFEMGASEHADGTVVEEVGLQTVNVIVQRKRFTNVGRRSTFQSESVHLSDLREAATVEVADLPSGPVCVVRQGEFEKVFVRMDMADAIADAVIAARAAGEETTNPEEGAQ